MAERVFKAVMFGAPRSGKTSLRNYFLYKNHTCQYLPTQNSDFVSTYVVLEKRQMIAMQIWDTGGSPVDRLTTSSLAQDADAIILVYDGTNPASLHALEPFLKRSKTIVDAVLPMVLVGTKADLPQEVNCAQAMDFCKSIADVDIVCIKTSARTGSNIEAVFQKVAELCQQTWYDPHAAGGLDERPLLPKARVSRHGDPITYHRFDIDDNVHFKSRKHRVADAASNGFRCVLRRLLCLS